MFILGHIYVIANTYIGKNHNIIILIEILDINMFNQQHDYVVV